MSRPARNLTFVGSGGGEVMIVVVELKCGLSLGRTYEGVHNDCTFLTARGLFVVHGTCMMQFFLKVKDESVWTVKHSKIRRMDDHYMESYLALDTQG
jgi:hypothetical protein